MRALTWQGTQDVRVETVDDPEIVNPRDAIIRVTSTAICGSDLHLYDGVIPSMKPGDVLELGPKAREMALVLEAQSLSERDVPEYVSVDGNKASYVRVPTLDEVPYPVKMEPNLVVEFYSR